METNLQESEQRNIESIRDANWNKAILIYQQLLKAEQKTNINIERMNQWVKMIKEKYDV